MVERQDVYTAANELLKQGKSVSVRSVRTFLGSGSNRDLGPFVSDWKEENSHQPRGDLDGVPLDLQNRHSGVLVALWASARALASAEFDDERKRMNAAIRAKDDVRDEALLEIDHLSKQVPKLEDEVKTLKTALQRANRHIERMRAQEFWSRLMREVADLLPPGGSITAEELLPKLRPSAHREATGTDETLTAKLLDKKMSTRARHKKLFVRLSNGSFTRLEGLGDG